MWQREKQNRFGMTLSNSCFPSLWLWLLSSRLKKTMLAFPSCTHFSSVILNDLQFSLLLSLLLVHCYPMISSEPTERTEVAPWFPECYSIPKCKLSSISMLFLSFIFGARGRQCLFCVKDTLLSMFWNPEHPVSLDSALLFYFSLLNYQGFPLPSPLVQWLSTGNNFASHGNVGSYFWLLQWGGALGPSA